MYYYCLLCFVYIFYVTSLIPNKFCANFNRHYNSFFIAKISSGKAREVAIRKPEADVETLR